MPIFGTLLNSLFLFLDVLTSTQFLIGFLSVLLLIAGIIVGLRYFVQQRSGEALKDKYQGTEESKSPLVRKYPEAKTLNNRTVLISFGLAVAFLLTLMSFNWTQFERILTLDIANWDFPEEVINEQPRTAEPPTPPPPPPPPPPPATEIETVKDEIKLEKKELKDQKIDPKDKLSTTPQGYTGPFGEGPPPAPKPRPRPKPKSEEPEVFEFVQQMPRFPGCEEGNGSNEEKQQCAQAKLIRYVSSNIRYPAMAQETGTQGVAVISFVVDEKGNVIDPKILRDPGAGLGKEALRIVRKMAKEKTWTPGRQRTKAVRVKFTLPVRFRLQ